MNNKLTKTIKETIRQCLNDNDFNFEILKKNKNTFLIKKNDFSKPICISYETDVKTLSLKYSTYFYKDTEEMKNLYDTISKNGYIIEKSHINDKIFQGYGVIFIDNYEIDNEELIDNIVFSINNFFSFKNFNLITKLNEIDKSKFNQVLSNNEILDTINYIITDKYGLDKDGDILYNEIEVINNGLLTILIPITNINLNSKETKEYSNFILKSYLKISVNEETKHVCYYYDTYMDDVYDEQLILDTKYKDISNFAGQLSIIINGIIKHNYIENLGKLYNKVNN